MEKLFEQIKVKNKTILIFEITEPLIGDMLQYSDSVGVMWFLDLIVNLGDAVMMKVFVIIT